jgi:Mor family transcriptional regulator
MQNDIDLFGLPDDDETRRQLIEHGGEDLPETKWAPQLAENVRVLEARYVRRGMAPKEAFDLAADSVLVLAEHHGGRMFYLPRGDRLRRALRDAEIFRKCNWRNFDKLAAEYKLSITQIYAIVRQQNKLNLGLIQPGLFEA